MNTVLIICKDGRAYKAKTKENINISFPYSFTSNNRTLTIHENEVLAYFIENSRTKSLTAWQEQADKVITTKEDDKLVNEFNKFLKSIERAYHVKEVE